MLSGCLGTKHLKENEKLLFRQRINAPKQVSKEDLKALYAQRPNRKVFSVLPISFSVGLYYFGLKFYDKEKFVNKKERAEKKYDARIERSSDQKKINNIQFRKQKKTDKYNSRIENGNQLMQWGEPVAVFDTSQVQVTVERFSKYLFTRGYFNNVVHAEVDTSLGKFVKVRYDVFPGEPYIIDSIFYAVPDSAVRRYLDRTQRQSYLKKGVRYVEENLSKERERIDLVLKDNGYYDFSRQYIDFEVDTATLGNKKVMIRMGIRVPARRGFHKQFVIDSVHVITDAGVNGGNAERQVKTHRDVQYSFFEDNYNLKVLGQRLFLSPGNLYSRSHTLSTQRQLGNLDAFKFVNVNYDTSGGKLIARVFTSPLDRYEWSNEVGVNVTQGFPGPFYNINFKKRNIFRGLENFDLNGRIGIEGVAAATAEQNVYRSTEAGVNASLTFPQFLWPFRDARQIRFAEYNPKTRVSLGYSFSDRPEYRRTAATFSNTYTWQTRSTTQFSLALTNISIINSTIKLARFDSLLTALEELGNFNLARSFQPSFVSSMILGWSWNKNYGSRENNSIFLRAQFESGGTSLNLIDPDIITRQGLQYFKYLRFNFDLRRINILNRWATLAYRFNTGFALTYGSNRVLPYEKYYFAGGSNSVRAWRPRRLGLGSQPPELSSNPEADGLYSYQFERPGEMLIEGSVELRTKLAGFINGAVFLDAGNVWLLRSGQTTIGGDVTNPQGNNTFRFNSFLRELGIGTGFGLRFDFTFLILRFDVGIKVYDPARPEGDRFVLNKVKFFRPFTTTDSNGNIDYREPVIYNIGIGYPF